LKARGRRVTIGADHLMPIPEALVDQGPAQKSGSASDQDWRHVTQPATDGESEADRGGGDKRTFVTGYD